MSKEIQALAAVFPTVLQLVKIRDVQDDPRKTILKRYYCCYDTGFEFACFANNFSLMA